MTIFCSWDVKPFTKIYFIWFKKSSLMTMARKGGMRVKGSLRTSCRALLTRLTFGERRSVSKRPWRPLWLQWYQRRPRPGHLILIVASPGIHLHSIGFITSQLHFGKNEPHCIVGLSSTSVCSSWTKSILAVMAWYLYQQDPSAQCWTFVVFAGASILLLTRASSRKITGWAQTGGWVPRLLVLQDP